MKFDVNVMPLEEAQTWCLQCSAINDTKMAVMKTYVRVTLIPFNAEFKTFVWQKMSGNSTIKILV
jgi:hypothetical protein